MVEQVNGGGRWTNFSTFCNRLILRNLQMLNNLQLKILLRIALVLGRLDDFSNIFAVDDVPASLYEFKAAKVRQRARKK